MTLHIEIPSINYGSIFQRETIATVIISIKDVFLVSRQCIIKSFFFSMRKVQKYRRYKNARLHEAGLPPTGTKKVPDYLPSIKQFSLTVQDDYSGHESTKIRMAPIILKRKLPKTSNKIIKIALRSNSLTFY